MTKLFHAWVYARFTEIQSSLRKKKLHIMNQSYNFLGGSSRNRNNVTATIQVRRKNQPWQLKRWFFLKNRPIHSHINNNISVIRSAKQNQLSFSSIKIKKPLPDLLQCLIDQIQVQKPIQDFNIMGVHWKIWSSGGLHKKPIYRGKMPEKVEGLGQSEDLRRAWQKRGR